MFVWVSNEWLCLYACMVFFAHLSRIAKALITKSLITKLILVWKWAVCVGRTPDERCRFQVHDHLAIVRETEIMVIGCLIRISYLLALTQSPLTRHRVLCRHSFVNTVKCVCWTFGRPLDVEGRCVWASWSSKWHRQFTLNEINKNRPFVRCVHENKLKGPTSVHKLFNGVK